MESLVQYRNSIWWWDRHLETQELLVRKVEKGTFWDLIRGIVLFRVVKRYSSCRKGLRGGVICILQSEVVGLELPLVSVVPFYIWLVHCFN